MSRASEKFVLVILSSAIVWAGCESAEISELKFETYHELASAQEPGNWIPVFIPRSAVQIRLKYKVDTGAQILAFQVEHADELLVGGSCRRVAATDLELIPSSGFARVDWWPNELIGEAASVERLRGYDLYRCERQASLAVLRNNEGLHAFYWSVAYRALHSQHLRGS